MTATTNGDKIRRVMAQGRSAHITREQVEKMRGKLKSYLNGDYNDEVYYCSVCGHDLYKLARSCDFCPDCGAPMTDKAVDILWKRLEAMQDEAETV